MQKSLGQVYVKYEQKCTLQIQNLFSLLLEKKVSRAHFLILGLDSCYRLNPQTEQCHAVFCGHQIDKND